MFGIIISGHRNFAKGIEETVELVLGKQTNIEFINFSEGMTPEILETNFKKAIDSFNLKETLFLTDISGGTPFSTAALMTSENIKVISGCNMAMVIEAINLREDQDLNSSIDEIIESAIEGIQIFQPISVSEVIEEDGI